MPEKKTAVLHVRVPQTLRDRIDKIEAKHRVAMASQLVDAVTALCDAVEREGRYAHPMHLIFGESMPLAGEGPQADYDRHPASREEAALTAAVAALVARTRMDAVDPASHARRK